MANARYTLIGGGRVVVAKRRIFSISGNNKGLPCPFISNAPYICPGGRCLRCRVYLGWLKKGELLVMCAWCGKVTDRKPGLGQAGVSHTICPECKEKHFPRVKGGERKRE